MREGERLSLEQIRAFLEASEEVHFEDEKRRDLWLDQPHLQVHAYRQQSRANRGLLRRYVEKLTGLSRAQVTRLIGRYLTSGEVSERSYRRHRFAQHDTGRYGVAGDRRGPDPQGQPGYLRIDTVHQGDLDGSKGCIPSMLSMKRRSGK